MTGIDVLAELVAGVTVTIVSSLWFADRVLKREPPPPITPRQLAEKRAVLERQRKTYEAWLAQDGQSQVSRNGWWASIEAIDRELIRLADQERRNA